MPQPDEPHYQLTVVAAMLEVHPNKIRSYERRGLVQSHLREGARLYSERSVQRLRRILSATQMGVNLSGAEVVCNLLERIHRLEEDIEILREQLRRTLEA